MYMCCQPIIIAMFIGAPERGLYVVEVLYMLYHMIQRKIALLHVCFTLRCTSA